MKDRRVKARRDGQMTGLAGEFFVAAELLKRGLQTSVTFGNAKSIDLFAVHGTTGRTFTIQVKAVAEVNYFLIDPKRVKPVCVYVFVLLNKPGVPPTFYVVPGSELASNPTQFGKPYLVHKMPGIHPKALEPFRDNWGIFDSID